MRCYGRDHGPEDAEHCVAEVTDFTGWFWHQCSRKRGYGPSGEYCKQHAGMIGCDKYVHVPEDR